MMDTRQGGVFANPTSLATKVNARRQPFRLSQILSIAKGLFYAVTRLIPARICGKEVGQTDSFLCARPFSQHDCDLGHAVVAGDSGQAIFCVVSLCNWPLCLSVRPVAKLAFSCAEHSSGDLLRAPAPKAFLR